jgi:hypothetical protein
MTQHGLEDFDPTKRSGSDLQLLFEALHSNHTGSTRPAYAMAGMSWVKSVSPTRTELMYFDGATDHLILVVNPATGVIIDVASFFRDASNLNAGTVARARLPISELSHAQIGTDNNTLMTPLRVAQAIAALVSIPDFASQAEAEAGTDNTKSMTPLRAAQALAADGYQSLTPTYESAELPHVGASRITANHGLGRVPHSWRVVKRITAASGGYLVGDEIDLTTQVDGDGARGYVSWVNATTINFFADTTHIQNTAADITGAAGSIVFYAW